MKTTTKATFLLMTIAALTMPAQAQVSATVTTDIAFRVQAVPAGGVIDTLRVGDQVTITDFLGSEDPTGYVRVSRGDDAGFVHGYFVRPERPEVGMSRDMLLRTIGYPDSMSGEATGSQRWTYRSGTSITLENRRVTEIGN